MTVTSNSMTATRIAVVTGATRRGGIGAAICRALAEAEIDIFFTHWNPYDAEMPWGADDDGPAVLQREIAALGVRCEGMEIDQSHPASATTIMDEVTRRLGVPHILVNNAAVSTDTDIDTLNAESLDAHYAVNVRTMALLCVELGRRFQEGSGGRIINMTSGQSLGPMPGELAYAASKGAVEALTVSLAPPFARRGITVNAVNPGPTDSGWMNDEVRDVLRPKFPFGRIGEPTDAARLVRFLASDDAAWITGQIIHSEGGFERQ